MNTSKLLHKGVDMFKKPGIEIGKAVYNCAKTVSYSVKTVSHTPVDKPPSAQELLNAALEWKKKNPNFSLPPGKSVISPLRDVPEEFQMPTFNERRRKENRTPEQKQLDEYFGDEHNI